MSRAKISVRRWRFAKDGVILQAGDRFAESENLRKEMEPIEKWRDSIVGLP
ncbi:MAG: hypothetical protein IPN36_02075 [Bacteroidetes bacterium]|nr:hypothetical protein [Bacteroidota bacterium]